MLSPRNLTRCGATSAVSAHPPVRAFLLELQRGMARTHDILMDGRDIGTVILPGATVKIFLTASAEARADRRFKELQEKGVATDYETVLEDIRQRDYQDSHRATAPLRQADQVVAQCRALVGPGLQTPLTFKRL